MQTAPTSPSNRTANDGSTAKLRNNREVEYRSFIREEGKKTRKSSLHSKRPNSHHSNKAKLSIKKNNSSPGNSKLGKHPKIEHKRMSSNFPGSFYVTPSAKYGGKANQTFLFPKGFEDTFIEKPQRRRNTSGLAPSKTQQERYKIYPSGRGSNTGPIKVNTMGSKSGNGSCRAVNVTMPDKAADLNRTQEIRTGSRTGRKIKVVNGGIKKESGVKAQKMKYKQLIPEERAVMKAKPKQTALTKEPEVVKVEIEKESEDVSKEIARKIKKVLIKDLSREESKEDKRDPELQKKLAEVHSFHQPPLPKLEDEQYSKDISVDDIMIGEVIGQGAYAVVKKGLYIPESLTIAIKIYDKSKLEEPQRRKSVKREIKLMEMMDNEYIVKLYGVIETRHQLYILMEYVSGLSLHGYLKLFKNRRLPEEEARRIFQQLMMGLQYCHKKCITHRDIKLENILLDENRNVKIIDFGFSTKIPNDQKVKMFCGTPSYMAPEIVTKQEYSGPPADIWASCVLLFALISGYFPYKGATDAALYERICSCESYPPEYLSDEAKEFLESVFQYDPDNRPSAEDIFYLPWMRLPISEKYSTGHSTCIGVSKSGISSQSSEEMYTRNYKPNLFATRTMKKRNPGMDAKEKKIKSKLFLLDDKTKKAEPTKLKIPKNLIAPPQGLPDAPKDLKAGSKLSKKGKKNNEKHYHLHLYHHFTKDKNSKAIDSEPSKAGSKVSSGVAKPRAHTESREGETQTTAEVGAVSGVSDVKRKTSKSKWYSIKFIYVLYLFYVCFHSKFFPYRLAE